MNIIKSDIDVQVSAVALCLMSVTIFPHMKTLSRLTAGNCQSNDDKQLQGAGDCINFAIILIMQVNCDPGTFSILALHAHHQSIMKIFH